MSEKKHNNPQIAFGFEHKTLFLYVLILYNLLFLTYILTLGYYNRLAWDDYAFMGHMRDNGFFSPFTYWFTNWQGRFGPQFLINAVLVIYKVIPNMFFYTLFMTAAFVYAIYQILRSYFPISYIYLLSYSTLLFSAVLLTAFEFNTFYLLNISAMYFGGVLFALLGIGVILNPKNSMLQHLAVGFCFLYVGSSSEHAGMLASLLLGVLLLIRLYKSGYNYRTLINQGNNRKIVIAFIACFAAFVFMILAPGNKIRMGAFQQITDPAKILFIALDATKFVLYHVFYKLPYTIFFIPPLLLMGTFLKDKIQIRKVNLFYLVMILILTVVLLIFISNLPVAYAMGSVGPMRSYVFISFIIVVLLSLFCVYAGYHYLPKLKASQTWPAISVMVLAAFVSYSFRSELPLVKKYRRSDKARVQLLNQYKEEGKTDTVFVQPLFKPEYVSITEMFRILTRTSRLPIDMQHSPVFVGDISSVPGDWRNNHLKFGLGLNFNVYLTSEEEFTAMEVESIKAHAEKAFVTSKFKVYLLDNYIYYEIHLPSYNYVLPTYIYCRVEPVDEIVKDTPGHMYYNDFKITDYTAKVKDDSGAYSAYIFIKKEITKFPIKRIDTGFFEMENGTAQYSDGLAFQLVPAK